MRQIFARANRLPLSLGSAALLSFGLVVLPGLCDGTSFADGIKAFKAGKYQSALDSFGAALPSEFQNAALHYYMANSYVHLKQRESCIREYRIAYALDPDREVGKLSKQALMTLGAGGFDSISASPKQTSKAEDVKLPPRDPDFDKALDVLRRQSGDYSLTLDSQAPPMNPLARQSAIGQSESNLLKALLETKEGTMVMPASARKELERLRALKAGAGNSSSVTSPAPTRNIPYTDASAIPSLAPNFFRSFAPPAPRGSNTQHSREIKESAKNLKNLLDDKRDGHRLVPQGTNLYVRNYKSTKNEKTK